MKVPIYGVAIFLIFRLTLLPAFSRESPLRLTSFPFPPEFSEEAVHLVEHPTFIRRLTSQKIPIRPAFFSLLAQDWDLAHRLAETVGIQGYEIQKLKQGWKVILDSKTFVDVIPLLHEPGRSVFLAKGEVHGTLIRSLRARAVLVLEYRPFNKEEVPATKNLAAVYLKVDHFLLGILTKMALPLIGKRIDRKLAAILRDVQRTGETIHQDPAGARKAIDRSPNFSLHEKAILCQFFTPILSSGSRAFPDTRDRPHQKAGSWQKRSGRYPERKGPGPDGL